MLFDSYAKFINQLSVLKINIEKDLDQVKTETHSLEKLAWIELEKEVR